MECDWFVRGRRENFLSNEDIVNVATGFVDFRSINKQVLIIASTVSLPVGEDVSDFLFGVSYERRQLESCSRPRENVVVSVKQERKHNLIFIYHHINIFD